MTNVPAGTTRPSRLRAEAAPRVRHYGGLPLAALTQEQVESLIAADLSDGVGGWLITANLDHLRRMRTDDEVRELLIGADLVVADGMPLVWAGRIAGTPVPERVAGSDLIFTLSSRAAEHDASVYLLGGSPGAADAAAGVLRRQAPQLSIAGTACPPFGFEHSPEALDSVVADVASAAPSVVFVGLGFPKQDRLIARLRMAHPDAWYVGCGVSIDFVAGFVPRAPLWMQRTGVEWVFRLTREPRKLTARYLIHGIPFATRLFAWAWRTRRGNAA